MSVAPDDSITHSGPSQPSGQSAAHVAAQNPEAHVITPVQIEEAPEEDRIPDGGYGWVIVACVFTINTVAWGK